MSQSINLAFIRQYETEVHQAYQQKGSKFRGTVRLKSNIVGESTTFQKVGKGTAAQKTRHGKVPVMNISHSTVTATLQDWYGGDYVDKLDELKINFDERQIQVNAGAWTLGRKIDELCITAMRTGIGSASKVAITYPSGANKGLSWAKCLRAIEILNSNDVPDDGQRFCAVGSHQWAELMTLDEFTNSDYIGSNLPYLQGTQPRRWMNVIWFMSTQLDLSGGVRYPLMYHRTALGLAEGMAGVWTDITWQGDYAAWFVNNAISAGAVRIDSEGIVEIAADDDAAFIT
ncbi:hypothetical protein LCGC14_1161280 [marine sediment metagenome]|uniref:Capsid protein n=1 Tax=marine sediment metagenome TaxID=412755 RepID=A0A0F9PY69_9ZZZZ|nr:hypothetical protein [Candidatus Aminicenantes bacterium]